MQTNQALLNRLLKRDIKPTAIRILVLKAMTEKHAVMSLGDLETQLDTVDKSTLFRTITLFQQRRLVHSIDDGTGAVKYALCDDECHCEIDQMHVHFLCTHCKQAFCFRDKTIPIIELPVGFSPASVSYVVKGKCSRCSHIAT